MAFLDRSKLLAKDKFRVEKVDLGNDDFVFVKQLSGRERDQFEASLLIEVKQDDGNITYERDTKDFRAKLATCTVCDEQGNLLLDPSDASELSKNITAAKLELITAKAQEINNMTKKEQDKIVKNSDAGQQDNSISDCAGN